MMNVPYHSQLVYLLLNLNYICTRRVHVHRVCAYSFSIPLKYLFYFYHHEHQMK